MFDFWFELPVIGRVIFAFAIMGVGAFIFFLTLGTRISIGLFALGFVLLLASGSGSNKGGYKF